MPQAQQVELHIKGLYSAPNDYTGIPLGALDQADDVVIDHESLAEPRRGYTLLAGNLPLSSDRVNRFKTYQSTKIVHFRDSKIAYYSAGTWNLYSGTYNHPDSVLARLRFIEAQKNLFFSTAAGIFKTDAFASTPAAAGVPKGLDLQLALTGSSGFLTTNTAATPTGKTVNGSPNLTLLSSITGVTVGQYIFGTGIAAGATVSSISLSAQTLISTGDIAAGSTSLANVPTNAGITVGCFISGVGIPANTRVASIAGAGPYTVTMDTAAIATTTGLQVTFLSDNVVTMSANASASGTGVSLTFSAGSQVGYRGLFGIRDANNNLLLGAPTQFASITNNTGTTVNVVVTMTLPAGITTSHFFQVYRSSQTASASISAQDEEQLVYEGNPNSTDITNGYVSITDSTPDSLRGATLYTSASQEGILQENDPPPFCKDFCLFRTFGIFANIKLKQRKKLTILSVGSPNGVQSTDTLIIGGVTFTADTTETVGTGHFKIFTGGTPAQNITDTTNSLIRVINRYATNTVVYARLLSGPTDLPGQILLEEQGVNGAAFVITASAHGAAYSPALPTSGTTITSTADSFKNALLISKAGQFEAVPEANILYAGDAAKEILRVIPLREYTLILKQDGVFRLIGTTLQNLQIFPFDTTVKLLSPDSAQALSNEVWGLFDQGVCSISDTGTNVRSRPIENTLRALVSLAPNSTKQYSFGISYETDRKYILCMPGAEGDVLAQQQYVFHTFTNLWTRWTRIATAGFVNPDDDKIYFGNNANTISMERKDNRYTDYTEEAISVSISAVNSKAITLNTVTGINIGDILYQSATLASLILAIDPVGKVVTVADLLSFTVAAASILPAINSYIQWKPFVAGNPMFVRQYSEGGIIFKRRKFATGTVSFYSDASQCFADTTITGFGVANFGIFPDGTQPWGGVNRPRSVRFLVPQEKQMASQLSVRLNLRNGYSSWAAEGLALSYNDASQEVGI